MRWGPAIDAVLRLEWCCVLAAALLAYHLEGGSWLLFAALILVPDLSMLGYLAGPRIGAATYNAAHLLVWPALLIVAGLLAPVHPVLEIGLVWLAHVAADRALGYGLKLPSGFRDTHLGRIGRD